MDFNETVFVTICENNAISVLQEEKIPRSHTMLKQTILLFQIPLPVAKINSTEHPVKVGLSDAFIAYVPSAQLSGQFS